MEITTHELTVLNFYRASELYGGLVLGQMVRRVRDPYLVLEMTKHAAEEIVHAHLWTETILAVGGKIQPTRDTYQSRYTRVVGHPVFLLHVLALTQVFERRVYRHFLAHARQPGTHPLVRATLERMIEEEKGHLSWVKEWLDQQALSRGTEVREVMRRYTEADEAVYASLLEESARLRAA